jgi:hypothetical protein
MAISHTNLPARIELSLRPSLSHLRIRIVLIATAVFVWTATLSAAAPLYVGSARCVSCHSEIGESYRRTPMARTSGAVTEAPPPGELVHHLSGTRYRIDGQEVRFEGGSHRLQYFIGSGVEGRSYLIERDGYLFLAPLTWYAGQRRWDMSPGYQQARANLWNRPIEPNCLFCHSTRAMPIFGTQNRYASPPFQEGGVGCERCHGPGLLHVESGGAIVNPAKLAAAEREDVCAQCHLTGEARIDRPDKQIAMFRPGARLSDYVSVFVSAEAASGGLRVTSHTEKLSYSRCRQSSPASLWCGTCHDPHRVPDAAGRDAWFRGRCLACHGGKLAAAHASHTDCTPCHMPRIRAADANHGVFTDHSIPRTPSRQEDQKRRGKLKAFPGFSSDDRSLGLAYAEIALESNDRSHRQEALRLLRQALPSFPNDWNLLTRLAYLEEPARALPLYERSLKLRPQQPVALVNAGTIHARQGNLPLAMEYWRRALTMNPALTEASRNLSTALRAAGRDEEARQVLRNAAQFVPGVDR